MPNNIAEWVTFVKDKPIPVLSNTGTELQILCKNEGIPVNKIVAIVERDPGLTAQLLRQCNNTRGHRLDRDISSIQQAVMLIGTQRLAGIAENLPKLETTLSETSRQQVLRTFCRAYHGASQAMYWARQRRDMTPDEVFAATLLHYLGEIVLSIHAPEQLLAAFKLRREKNISSEEAQYLTLGFTLDQLSLAIAEIWRLPTLVREALQAENANHPRGFGIMLAVQLSRIATIDWYSDKMRSIYKHAATLLPMEEDEICRQAHLLAVDIARQNKFKGVLQAATLLPRVPVFDQPGSVHQSVSQDYQADVCLIPQLNIIQQAIKKLSLAGTARHDKNKLLKFCLQGLHDGIGLNRVVFARFDPRNHELILATSVGADNDPVFNKFKIKLENKNLFRMLLDKSQAVVINDDTREKYWHLVPKEFQKLIGTNSFMAMSIFEQQKPLGIVYADRHTSSCQIDENSYQYFKKMCQSFTAAVEQAISIH